MRAPEFWSGDATGRDAAPLVQALLRPLSWAYGGAARLKAASAKPERAAARVICVGNVTVGGTGKTPLVRMLRGRIAARGLSTATLSRGHGGRLVGPLAVGTEHDAAAVGDEPLLHARDGLAIVARDRAAGARLAVARGAQAILMDDGFQNFDLEKDLALLVFDGAAGLGNGRLLPAGPLREPLAQALRRADALVVTGPPSPRLSEALSGAGLPVLNATLALSGALPDGPLIAFAGIGRPEKFFDALKAAGATLIESVPFPDHHRFQPQDIAFLQRLARDRGATLVTTEKDHVRLPAPAREAIHPVPADLRVDDSATLDALLDRALCAPAA